MMWLEIIRGRYAFGFDAVTFSMPLFALFLAGCASSAHVFSFNEETSESFGSNPESRLIGPMSAFASCGHSANETLSEKCQERL
jgi:hypothetical protein